MLLTRDHIALLQYDNVEDIAEIKNSLMIKAEVKKIGHLKYYSMYLLNDAKYVLQEKPLEYVIDNGVEKVLTLATELLKTKIIEMMKKYILKIIRNYL